jgi:3-hydroxyisobutyrate dehydrogenase-like beta-hydroxyacid dehydrogenase
MIAVFCPPHLGNIQHMHSVMCLQVVNMLMGTMMASFAESLVLAEAAGLSKKDLVEVVGLGAVAAPMYALKVAPPPSMAVMMYLTYLWS